jgi:hypothetical protein
MFPAMPDPESWGGRRVRVCEDPSGWGLKPESVKRFSDNFMPMQDF